MIGDVFVGFLLHLVRIFIMFIMIVATPACAIGMVPDKITKTEITNSIIQNHIKNDLNLGIIKDQALKMKIELTRQKEAIKDEKTGLEDYNQILNTGKSNLTAITGQLSVKFEFEEGGIG